MMVQANSGPASFFSRPAHISYKHPWNVWKELHNKPAALWNYLTAHTEKEFDIIFDQVSYDIACIRWDWNRPNRVRCPIWTTKILLKNRLLLALFWLQFYSPYYELGFVFGVSITIISWELHHVISIMYYHYQRKIKWPSAAEQRVLEGTIRFFSHAIGSVDCTCRPICCPLRVQGLYYCKDKGFHSIISIVVTDVFGRMRFFKTGYIGSQNDTCTYMLSGISSKLTANQWLLTDGGFSGQSSLITPFPDYGKNDKSTFLGAI